MAAIVKKGNVELTVSDHLIDEYLEMGYSLLDENGKTVRRKPCSSDIIAELNESVRVLKSRNETLESENVRLNSEIVKLNKKINALKASHNDSNEVLEDTTTNYPPKKTRANRRN